MSSKPARMPALPGKATGQRERRDGAHVARTTSLVEESAAEAESLSPEVEMSPQDTKKTARDAARTPVLAEICRTDVERCRLLAEGTENTSTRSPYSSAFTVVISAFPRRQAASTADSSALPRRIST